MSGTGKNRYNYNIATPFILYHVCMKITFMQTLYDNSFQHSALTQSLIFKMIEAPLSNVPFHHDTPSITRFFTDHFPCHVAIHEVSPVFNSPLEYTQLHVHDDSDEINLLISKTFLSYKIQLDNDVFEVNSNSSIWIPKGVWHSANVIKGAGFYITLRL